MPTFLESNARSLTKTIVWRIVATFITWLVIYLFTGEILESVKVTLVAAIAGMVFYYFHERVWNKINWGKVLK